MTTTEMVVETMHDDATLVSRAREGDMRAYEQLVVRHRRQMFRLADRMLADHPDAEDIVQEVFLGAWHRLPQLHEDAAFVGWLYRMTTNRCLNMIRARRPTVEVNPETTESPHSNQPENAVQLSSALTALNAALGLLTPEQRTCWLLREVHELTYEEIGDIVEASTTAVRGRLARARAHVCEVMQPWR